MRYMVGKVIFWEASHVLEGLAPGHQCGRVHGHSYRADIALNCAALDENGMAIDFGIIGLVRDKLDHQHLNDILKVNPTAENIAKFIYDTLMAIIFKLDYDGEVAVASVKVWETKDCWAEYLP